MKRLRDRTASACRATVEAGLIDGHQKNPFLSLGIEIDGRRHPRRAPRAMGATVSAAMPVPAAESRK